MPRNGSGTYSLPVAPFTPQTVISSTAVNSDFSDISTALTGSLARDGQGGMTAVLPLDNTGFSYSADPNTGVRRTAADTQAIYAGGVDTFVVTSTGSTTTGDSNTTGVIKQAGVAVFPVGTSNIADGSVTNAKLADFAAGAFIVRYTASSGVPQYGSFGANLSLNTSTGILSNPAFAPQAAFKALVIKVTNNTTGTIAADYVTMFDGTNMQTAAVAVSMNLGVVGAAGLDSGSIASGTWYALWAIAKADGTVSAIASTSSTAPTMPSGYTYKARVGWWVTASGSAQLMGTWQMGCRAQYVVGLAQTTMQPLISSGPRGTFNVATPVYAAVSISNYAPSTASAIALQAQGARVGVINSNLYVAPNGNYSGLQNVSPTNAPPPLVALSSQVTTAWFLLESTNVYVSADSLPAYLFCTGWEDNI